MKERSTTNTNLVGRILSWESLVAVVAAALIASMLGVFGPEARAQGDGGDDGGDPESVTLALRGDEGTSFSGWCTVGENRRQISGQVPERFEFEVDDEKLACEIRKRDGQGGDALVVAMRTEDSRSVQRIEGQRGTVELTYGGGAISSSMSSSSRAQTGTNDNSSSTVRENSEGDGNAGDLADRIQKMVDDILSRAIS